MNGTRLRYLRTKPEPWRTDDIERINGHECVAANIIVPDGPYGLKCRNCGSTNGVHDVGLWLQCDVPPTTWAYSAPHSLWIVPWLTARWRII